MTDRCASNPAFLFPALPVEAHQMSISNLICLLFWFFLFFPLVSFLVFCCFHLFWLFFCLSTSFPFFFTSLALHRMTFLKLWCFLCHLTFMLWQCSSYRCIFLETLLLTQTSLRNIQLFNFAVWATAGVKAQSDPCHRCKCVRGQWAGLIIQTNFCPVQDHPVSTQMTTSNLSTLPYFVQLFHFPFFLSCVLVSWWKCNERRASEGMKNSLIVFSGGGKESRGRNKNLMSWGSVRQSTLRGKLGKCVVTEAPPV